MNRLICLGTSLACGLALCTSAYADANAAKSSKITSKVRQPEPVRPGMILTFKNAKSKKCIGVKDASKKNGALVQQFDCDNRPNQKWQVRDVNVIDGVSVFALRNVKSEKCMGVDGASVRESANIGQYNCDTGAPNQRWVRTTQGWMINEKSTNHAPAGKVFCIGVNQAKTNEGAQLKQFHCDGKANQQWFRA
jgi:hypothetical protein